MQRRAGEDGQVFRAKDGFAQPVEVTLPLLRVPLDDLQKVVYQLTNARRFQRLDLADCEVGRAEVDLDGLVALGPGTHDKHVAAGGVGGLKIGSLRGAL